MISDEKTKTKMFLLLFMSMEKLFSTIFLVSLSIFLFLQPIFLVHVKCRLEVPFANVFNPSVVDGVEQQHGLRDDVVSVESPTANSHHSIDANGVGVSSARSHNHPSSTIAESACDGHGCGSTDWS